MKHVAALLVTACLASASTAHADPTCIAAYEQTQTLRKDGKPVAAKAQASICAKDACPALLTKDCTKWLAELETIIPSVVLDPRSPAGTAFMIWVAFGAAKSPEPTPLRNSKVANTG